MRARYWLLTLLVLAFPRPAAAQLDALTNVAACVVASGYDAAATSIDVNTGCGATLPAAPFNVSWCDTTTYPVNCRTTAGVIDPKYEVVRVTAKSTDTLTITRAQESTSGSTKNTGGKVYWISTFTAKTITDVNTALGASTVTLGTNSVLTNERVLTGTSNQITVTDGGAGSTVTLSTPQNLHTAATPTFGGLTVSNLTSGRVPYASTAGLLADTADFRFDATAANSVFRARLLNTATAQGGITNEMHTLRLIMKGNGASQIQGLKRGLYVQMDDDTVANVTITGAANNGSGLVRITAASHGYTTGDGVGIYGVTGTTEANGVWVVTVITANTFDLQGSTFANAYVSGGTATNRSSMTGVHVLLQPTLSRTNAGVGTNVFNDDLNGYTVQAIGNGKATDAFYVAGNPSISGAPAYVNAFATDANSNFFFRAIGTAYTAGIDLASATYDTGVPAIRLGAAADIQLDTATGTKIGTATTQKLGFFNATPIVQNTSTTDLRTGLINLGFFASGGASPLNLNGGAFTAAAITGTGRVQIDTTNAQAASTDAAGTSRIANLIASHTLTDAGFTSPVQSNSFVTHLDFASDPGSKAVNNMLSFLTTASDAVAQGSLTLRGFAPTVQHNGTATLGTALSNSATVTNASSGTITTARGAQGIVTNSSTGTITDAEGVRGSITNTNASGTISNAYHFAATGFSNSGTLTNTFGFYVNDISAGTQTNTPMAFFNADANAPSNFNATVNIGGGTTPNAVAVRATTEGTNQLKIFDGTAPVGTLTNGVSLYSASGELRVMDAAGNWTQLSPHDDATNEYVYFSVNTETGKVLRIDMERLLKRLDALVGGGFVTEYLVEPGGVAANVPMQGRLVPRLFPWAMFSAALRPQGVRQ